MVELSRHDIVIVGGGAAGLRAAIAIAEEAPDLSLAVVSPPKRGPAPVVPPVIPSAIEEPQIPELEVEIESETEPAPIVLPALTWN